MDEVRIGDAFLKTEEEGILEFLKKLDASSMSEMYEKWRFICEELEVNLDCVRNVVDSWFLECYQSRKDVHKLNADVSWEMAERRKEELLEKFHDEMKLSASRCDDIVRKMSIKREVDAIMNLPPGCWVNRAIECVEKENELMANFKKVRYEVENEEMTQQMEQSIQQSASLCSKISQRVNEFCTGVNNYQRNEELMREKLESIDKFQHVLSKKSAQKNMAASQKKLSDLEAEKQQLQESIDQTVSFLTQCLQDMNDLLSLSYKKFTQLITDIMNHVNVWKRQFQLEYAELAAAPNLNRVAPWCALVGKQIYDLLVETLPRYSNSLKVFESDIDNATKSFEDLLHNFMQQTFVVTEQEHYIVKVDKKHLPKIVVRILAADYFPAHSSLIDARFLYEDHINESCPSENVDIKTLETICPCADFENKKRSLTVSFQKGKNRKYSEGVFSSLQFKGKFVRPENTTSKQVHEEKYRILFITKIKDQKLWTISLPFVVTTGANQGCLCQASIMWQCFSSDVYKVPIVKTNDLKWCQVAEMLQAKVRKLCPDHILNEDNLIHLKRRLFGKDVDHDIVSLKMFCFDKMIKTYGHEEDLLNFSFWKWFIGVYNLIDRYLLNFWKEGLIFGFISKEEAKEKLKRCNSGRSGTFILRFSDQNITDSQGVKSVFAHLTATVLFFKEKDGRKKKCIYDLDVAGHSKLKSKNLANILMETQAKESACKVYQFVYPGKRRREDTFDKHCNEELVVAGYTGAKDAFIVELNQAMSALEIDTGKHYRSSSVDSGFAPSPLGGGEPLAAPVKRPRASLEQQHPTISKMLNNGMFSPSYSPAYSQSSSGPSQSPYSAPFSPNFQPESPALVNNSPPNSMLHQQANMSPIQNEFVQSQDAIYPSLPTVINDVVDNQTGSVRNCNKTGIMNLNKGSCQTQGVNGRTCSTSPLDGCEPKNGCSSLSDESGSLTPEERSMEVTISNDDYAPLQNGGSVIYMVQEEGGEYKAVPVNPTMQNILSITNQQSEDQLLQNNITSANQIEVSSISDQKLLLASALLNSQLPDVQKTLQQTVDFNPALESFPNLKITTQPTISSVNNAISSASDVMMCCSSSTLETPTLTSAGSVSEAFNFSNSEIAEAREVNSGNIDVSMFDQALSSSTGLPTSDSTSSGSSFGYGSV